MYMHNSKKPYTAPKIEKETDGAKRTWTPGNLYGVKNVNVAQGPRVGVHGAAGKRESFMAAKADREPLATIIQDAYEARAHEYAEFEYTNGGSIHDNTYEKTKKEGVKLGSSNKRSQIGRAHV